MEEGRKNHKKAVAWICAVLLLILALLGGVQAGVIYRKNSCLHWSPDYEKRDISALLEKDTFTKEEYRVLYEQTGLTELGVDGLLSRGEKSKILAIQEGFFGEYGLVEDHFGAFTYMYGIDGQTRLAHLENGDILVSSSTFTSWFQYGHSALVVDGELDTIIESVSMGHLSEKWYAGSFASRANFLVLRPDLPKEQREEIALWAKDNLVGVPYRLTTGIFSRKYQEEIKTSHCSHLVWYAYKKFGVDLDSNGGAVVTPRDIARSPRLKLVQCFGFDIDELWG